MRSRPGYGVTFISRSAVEPELAAGSLTAAQVEGLDARREISLVRASGRTPTRVAEAFVEFARGTPRRDRPLGARGAAGAGRASGRSSSRASAGALSSTPRIAGTRSRRTGSRCPTGVDTIVAIGGGSAIDTAKAASAASGLPLVSVPTTYSGAEWTSFFGVRDPDRQMRGGGAGAHLHAIVYDPQLTLGLPLPETVGTSLNALAHCAEALYVQERTPESDATRSRARADRRRWLPRVVEQPDDPEPREQLLEAPATPAPRSAARCSRSGTRSPRRSAAATGAARRAERADAAGGAPVQRAGGRRAIARFGAALGADDPAARVEELARLGGFERLRDLGIPEDAATEVAEAAAAAGTRRRTPAGDARDAEALIRSIW